MAGIDNDIFLEGYLFPLTILERMFDIKQCRFFHKPIIVKVKFIDNYEYFVRNATKLFTENQLQLSLISQSLLMSSTDLSTKIDGNEDEIISIETNTFDDKSIGYLQSLPIEERYFVKNIVLYVSSPKEFAVLQPYIGHKEIEPYVQMLIFKMMKDHNKHKGYEKRRTDSFYKYLTNQTELTREIIKIYEIFAEMIIGGESNFNEEYVLFIHNFLITHLLNYQVMNYFTRTNTFIKFYEQFIERDIGTKMFGKLLDELHNAILVLKNLPTNIMENYPIQQRENETPMNALRNVIFNLMGIIIRLRGHDSFSRDDRLNESFINLILLSIKYEVRDVWANPMNIGYSLNNRKTIQKQYMIN